MADRCEHHDFQTNVGIGRLSDGEGGPIVAFTAEIRIECVQCGRKFQFLGLPAGVDMKGATVSIDGLEARMAICPEGEAASPLDDLVVASAAGASKH